MIATSRKCVITGTSGTGKTTLVEQLRKQGYSVFDEPTRLILSEQMATDGPGLPSKNPKLFLEMMLDYCIRCKQQADTTQTPVAFFDRGVPDIVAYAIRFGVDPESFQAAARLHRYDTCVFVLPPWQEIFVPDDFRGKSFAEYVRFHETIVASYEELGYDLIRVPFLPVDDRARFVVKAIE